MFLGFKNLKNLKKDLKIKFCRTEYRLSFLQVSNFLLSGSNFMEVSVRHLKHQYGVIMTSFLLTILNLSIKLAKGNLKH